ncbi:MAG: histidine kinase [Bacteroidota bacterium]|nr:histidine kinase [Bacteroidota bacterium]
MKKYLLLFFLLLTFTLSSQIYGPAQGFPSDPVISATWYNDRLYLGTQGSGVYEFKDGFIQHSRRFEKFNRSSIYDFQEVDTGLVPLISGELNPYPIVVSNEFGTKYIINEENVRVKFSDAANSISALPSGIWRMILDGERLNFLRMGSELVVLNDLGEELDKQKFQGLLFDLAPTEYGLVLSAESGYYRWNNGWKKIGSGLPIFAFDGKMARTPLGSIEVNKLFTGNWSSTDFSQLAYKREEYEFAYDIDSIGTLTYTFSSRGVTVASNNKLLYHIDSHRELPDLHPGNYDVAIIAGQLYVATPSGMYIFENGGQPNIPYQTNFKPSIDGIPTEFIPHRITAPNSLSFSADVEIASNTPILGRYRVNDATWEYWDINGPILLEYPAPGNYKLQIQVDSRPDFASSEPTSYTFKVYAIWFKRTGTWVGIIMFFAALIVVWQRKERLRANERLELQERLAEAELQSKRGQMNPHFLFNALDAISNFILKNQPKDAVLYMGKLAKLMRLTLESSRSNKMVLADEIELLVKYVDLSMLRYGKFKWQLNIDDTIDQFELTVPPMLLQPLVENSVQHAVRPNIASNKSGAITTNISLRDNHLLIVIEDNGPGIQHPAQTSKSHGLAILKERLELLSRKNDQAYDLQLESVENSGSIFGTRVSLILPIKGIE